MNKRTHTPTYPAELRERGVRLLRIRLHASERYPEPRPTRFGREEAHQRAISPRDLSIIAEAGG